MRAPSPIRRHVSGRVLPKIETPRQYNDLQWQFAAAAYTKFDSTPGNPGFQDADYNALQIKPVDSNTLSAYQNSDKAGTPEGSIGTPTPTVWWALGTRASDEVISSDSY